MPRVGDYRGFHLSSKIASRLLWLCLALPLVTWAQSRATVTILEGQAELLRETTRYALSEGVRLAPLDIVQTTDKAFVRIEFGDGSRADLAATTSLLNAAPSPVRVGKSGSASQPFLLSGLMKFSADKTSKADYRYATPHFTVTTANSVAVVHVTGAEASVFLESGEVSLVELGPKGASAAQRLKAGEFYTRKNGQKSVIAPRPSQAFLRVLPRGFLDTIPSRLARFKDREAAPKHAAEIAYTDVETWLKTNRMVRRPLVQRWRPRANDAAFRTALIANLKHHPEWDPILFPEKYKPKEEKSPAGTPTGTDVQ